MLRLEYSIFTLYTLHYNVSDQCWKEVYVRWSQSSQPYQKLARVSSQIPNFGPAVCCFADLILPLYPNPNHSLLPNLNALNSASLELCWIEAVTV